MAVHNPQAFSIYAINFSVINVRCYQLIKRLVIIYSQLVENIIEYLQEKISNPIIEDQD